MTQVVVVETISHPVIWGDTLSKLAIRYYSAWEHYPKIAARNQIGDPNLIIVGQILAVDVEKTVEVPVELTVPTPDVATAANMAENAAGTQTDSSSGSVSSDTSADVSAPTGATYQATGYSCSQAEGTSHFVNGTEVCNLTASGVLPYWGAVAVDPSQIKLGSVLRIAQFPDTLFTAVDTGGAIKGNRVDIWFPSRESAVNFGVQNVTVQIVDPNAQVSAQGGSTGTTPEIAAVQEEPVPTPPPASADVGWQWPTTITRLSDHFGVCRGVNCSQPHTGLDIALWEVASTHTHIMASRSGVVTTSYCMESSYGCYIILDHGDSYSSLYAHLSALYVAPGESVAQGQVLGMSGSTGYSTGEHLHFEIRKNGVPQDPLNYLN